MKFNAHLSLAHTSFIHAYRRRSGTEYTDISHFHEGIEFLYIEQGHGSVVTGSKSVEVSGGTLLFFQPFQFHKLGIQTDDTCPFIRSFFVYNPIWMQQYLEPFPRLAEFHRSLWKMSWETQVLTGLDADHPLVKCLSGLGQLTDITNNTKGSNLTEAHSIFILHFLMQLQHNGEIGKQKHSAPGRKMGHIEQAMEWIEEHYRSPFRLQTLADHLHLTPAYLSGLFRREVGGSLSDYWTARRIKEACHLLTTGDLALDQVAAMVGISNVSYFCQLFKRHTSETPHQFRTRINKTGLI
jgi:AraC family transcriptional regulator of arabinose operon